MSSLNVIKQLCYICLYVISISHMSTTMFASENTTIFPATCEDIRAHFARKGINVPRQNRMIYLMYYTSTVGVY